MLSEIAQVGFGIVSLGFLLICVLSFWTRHASLGFVFLIMAAIYFILKFYEVSGYYPDFLWIFFNLYQIGFFAYMIGVMIKKRKSLNEAHEKMKKFQSDFERLTHLSNADSRTTEE